MKRTFLDRANAAYELLADWIPDPGRGSPEVTLDFVECLAGVAWHAHPGKYADGKLENVLLGIGEDLEAFLARLGVATDWELPPVPIGSGRHLLHVATEVYAVGGHTRFLKNWVQSDPTSVHSVLLTRQSPSTVVPSWFSGPIAESGGQLIALPPNAPRLWKAKWLRDTAQSCDAVILHHHPSDVVPTVAFAITGLPPVAVLNHADHVFWLGSGVSDLVINIRPAGKRLSEERRMVSRNELLPIPMDVQGSSYTRSDARRALGITGDEVIILTIGSQYKYIPNETHNFYTTATAILDQHPNVHLYMVGVEARYAERYVASRHARLHCLGIVEDPSPHYAAADLYLEGFPFGSITALLQAALQGLPVVLRYGIGSPALVTDDIAGADIARASNEAEYLEQVTNLIRDPDRRAARGKVLRDRVWLLHTGAGWQQTLHEIYGKLSKITHEPHALPFGAFQRTADDVALSKLQAAHDDGHYFRLLSRHGSELNVGALARLFLTLPAVRPNRPIYKYYGKWAREVWRRVTQRKGGR